MENIEKDIQDIEKMKIRIMNGIECEIKKFKKIMGPNTKKLIYAKSESEFKDAFKKKNWKGTLTAHAAAILAKGVLVMSNVLDKQGIVKKISTLQNVKDCNNYIEEIIKTFGDSTKGDELEKIITKDKDNFFRIIRNIFRKVSDEFLKPVETIKDEMEDDTNNFGFDARCPNR